MQSSILTQHTQIEELFKKGKSPADIKSLLSIPISTRSIQRYIKRNIGSRPIEEAKHIALDKQIEGIHRYWKGHIRASKTAVNRNTRYQVLKRDNFKCVLCGRGATETLLTVDHITPKVRQGKNTLTNYRTLCFDCNVGRNWVDYTNV